MQIEIPKLNLDRLQVIDTRNFAQKKEENEELEDFNFTNEIDLRYIYITYITFIICINTN
jgi:hypothetical protein